MRSHTIRECGLIKLTSFHPLCKNEFGLTAINTFDLSPFIDASCRREPDFENPNPSISALCRAGKFAPHLKKNEVVTYITIKGSYPPYNIPHYRLVAILQIEEVYQSHKEAAGAYMMAGLPIPSNCIVNGNPPQPFSHTASRFQNRKEIKSFIELPYYKQQEIGEQELHMWNNAYLNRSRKYPTFVKASRIFCEVNNPPPLFDEDLLKIFNKIPGTRSGKKIHRWQLNELAKKADIELLFNDELNE